MSKKKNNNALKEAIKAQATMGRDFYSQSVGATAEEKIVLKDTLTLPVVEIKKDLLKDLVFAVFSIGVLIYLTKSGIGFTQISSFFGL